MTRSLAFALVLGCGHSSPQHGDDAPPADARPDEPDAAALDASPDAALGACANGSAPMPELCDGVVDEDCDGSVDEDCSTDPFVAESCGGPAPTAAQALAELGAATRKVLAPAHIQVRTRSCPNGACTAWSAGQSWWTHFLTWSGGVTTRYQDVLAETKLVLFVDGGAPKLSLQHATFPQGGYPDTRGIVFGFPAAAQMYPRFYAYNVAPVQQYDYRDLEIGLSNGVLAVGTRCARFTATVYGAMAPYTTEYAALYRW